MANKNEVALWVVSKGQNIKTDEQYVSYVKLILNFLRQFGLNYFDKSNRELLQKLFEPVADFKKRIIFTDRRGDNYEHAVGRYAAQKGFGKVTWREYLSWRTKKAF